MTSISAATARLGECNRFKVFLLAFPVYSGCDYSDLLPAEYHFFPLI